MTYLVDVCTVLGDTARAAILYQLLLPYAGRTVVIGNAIACYGAASRYLGMLVTAMACWDEAEQHFTDALSMNARLGARPWLAHTQHQYAQMLSTRNRPGDHAKATALQLEALTIARELGMRTLEARLTDQQGQTVPPRHRRRPLYQPQHRGHPRTQYRHQDWVCQPYGGRSLRLAPWLARGIMR
jgi:hypothetical protein